MGPFSAIDRVAIDCKCLAASGGRWFWSRVAAAGVTTGGRSVMRFPCAKVRHARRRGRLSVRVFAPNS
eukprot:3121103-Lingulodinium_polyedra.AAC.1